MNQPLFKYPKSAFMIYLRDIFDEIKNNNPNISFTQVTSIGKDLWNYLEPNIKLKYIELADMDKKRYFDELTILYDLIQYINIKSDKIGFQFDYMRLGDLLEMTLQLNNINVIIVLSKNILYSLRYKINYNFNVDDTDYIEDTILFKNFNQIFSLIDDVIYSMIPPSIDY